MDMKLICPRCNCDKIFKFAFNECYMKSNGGRYITDRNGDRIVKGRFQCVNCSFRGVADKFIK